ncbi:MAG TPA: metal-sulfur cluster assembly factor [Candidatus Micrarchaeia archaeon]|nr:metal-sulfur cluster assembly factor [Candidatus Micrarchaeia archaeon]
MTEPEPVTERRATGDEVMESLRAVIDPEIGLDIVSLGLVYTVTVDEAGVAQVELTLTTPYCPLGPVIETQVHAAAAALPGITDVRIDLVWSPPWDPHTMASEEARLELGIY